MKQAWKGKEITKQNKFSFVLYIWFSQKDKYNNNEKKTKQCGMQKTFTF